MNGRSVASEGTRSRSAPAAGAAPTGPAAAGPEAWPTGRLLSMAARRVERAWDAYLEQWSLTHASLPVLAVLAAGPHSQREVARALKVTEQTMSTMLTGLEQVGYVRRERHAEDRRRHVVAISDAGLDALRAIDDPAVLERMVSTSLTADQLGELRAMLLTIIDAEPSAERPADDRGGQAGGERADGRGADGQAGGQRAGA